MKKICNNIFKHSICFLLIVGLILSSKLPGSETYRVHADSVKDKKAIILILDRVTLDELVESKTPNMDFLVENGSMGLMNTRSRTAVTNKVSNYLSLGMGVKTSAALKGDQAFNRDFKYPLVDYSSLDEKSSIEEIYRLYTGSVPPAGEIVNIAISDIEKTALAITPNNEVGLLGNIARENGLKIGLLGNNDLDGPSRPASVMLMDEKGVIPYGNIGSRLLAADPTVLGGIRLDKARLMEEVDRILPSVDMLFLDYGDAVRIEESNHIASDSIIIGQKMKAIERADAFLGEIFKKVDMDSTLFMVLTPNPSKESISNGNFGLTPFILSGGEVETGLLTSDTTNRKGLVANFNFAPTLLDYFDIEDQSMFIGGPMTTIETDDARDILVKNENEFLYLRKYRKVFHWSFIALAGLSLLGLFVSKFTRFDKIPRNILKYLGLTTLSVPLTMMLVSVVGYRYIVIDLLFVVGGAFCIAYILSKIFKNNVKTIITISFATSLFLLVDMFFIKELMIVSPLGSDAIAGGRFYGIGNDYMGILLGSSILGIFSSFYLYDIKKHVLSIFTIIYMLVVVIALSPFFGANVGGTLSAMFVTIVALFVMFDKKFSLKKVLALLVGVVLAVILLAILDLSLNPNPTHAGKALEGLMSGGLSKFIEIITIKLKQVVWNLAYASWNIILFLEVVIMVLLFKFKEKTLKLLDNKYAKLLKGYFVILVGGLIVFLFNDTGTIAAAIMLTYLFIPLGMLMKNIE